MTPRLLGIFAAVGLMTLAASAAAFTAQSQTRPSGSRADPMAGLGERPGTPAMKPLALDPNVIILSVKGFDNQDDCKGPEIGVGDEELCLTLCNYGDVEALVVLNTAVALNSRAQNTMLIDREPVTAPPGSCGPGGIDTEEEKEELKAKAAAGTLEEGIGVTYRLKTMCLNIGRDVPGEGDTYVLGGTTTNPQLLEIERLIRDKDLTDDDAKRLVQDAIWQVTDFGGLTNEMRAKLRAL